MHTWYRRAHQSRYFNVIGKSCIVVSKRIVCNAVAGLTSWFHPFCNVHPALHCVDHKAFIDHWISYNLWQYHAAPEQCEEHEAIRKLRVYDPQRIGL